MIATAALWLAYMASTQLTYGAADALWAGLIAAGAGIVGALVWSTWSGDLNAYLDQGITDQHMENHTNGN